MPTVDAEPMMTLHVELRNIPLGATPAGERIEIPFEGTATSPHWSGTWEVAGVDHLTVGPSGIARIDVHTVIWGDGESVGYRGLGRGGPDGLIEGVVFETSSERLAWMNGAVAVGRGTLDGSSLTVELFRARP